MIQYKLFTTLMKTKPTRDLLNDLKRREQSFCVPMLKEWIQRDYVITSPTISYLGKGCVSQLTTFLVSKPEIKKCLLVTSVGMDKFDAYKKPKEAVLKANKLIEEYTTLKENPSTEQINEIVTKYQAANCDCLIAIGGGTAHDAVKAASLQLVNPKELIKYQGLNPTKVKPIFKIHVNTTAGTCAEVTNVVVVTDTNSHRKFVVADKYLTPDVTFNDPDLMMQLPPSITAFTGADALVHAVESYLSNDFDIQAKEYALEALHLIFKYLPIAVKEPSNEQAREMMCYAQYLAGYAFNITSLGIVHSMSHALTAMFGTPHGLANAMLLPHILTYELRFSKVVALLNRIARSFGINGDNSKQNSLVFISKVKQLFESIGIPSTLQIKDHPDITDAELEILTKQAMIDFCGISNPIQFKRKELKQIYRYAQRGGK